MGTVGTILKLFSITLGVCLSTIIIEGPKNAFVLLNSDATFNCTVSQPWHVIIWLMNSAPVLTIVPKGPIVTDPQFGQRNYTTQDRFTSELVITAVTLKNNATVQCNLQTDGHQQARLFVQVAGMVFFESKISSVVINQSTDIVCKAESWSPAPTISWTINQTAVNAKMYTNTFHPASEHLYNADSTLNLTLSANAEVQCLATIKALPQPRTAELFITVKPPNQDETWLIVAIVVPIIGVILLIILIIIIVFCIKRSKHTESSYQNELRKISRKKSLEATGNGLNNSGLENFGMSTESMPSSRQVDSWPGSMSNDALETPEGPTSNRGTQKAAINQYIANIPTYPRKTRHVTAV
ncbi:immunoglobulin superfamily member 5-like isoform X2 [Scyliorhinus canicula]|uniref:immunoglobulin superfamily member 5-like isoform X2 n=1 Tax=Scyliorhinus canicula TaxID=7830 RepID=UPI0018F55CB5|nr:immunoglobulin superfamily member 5-like isoform X2 [Scyliorhinus canicula]